MQIECRSAPQRSETPRNNQWPLPQPPFCRAGPDPAPRGSEGGLVRVWLGLEPVTWIPARGPGRHFGLGGTGEY